MSRKIVFQFILTTIQYRIESSQVIKLEFTNISNFSILYTYAFRNYLIESISTITVNEEVQHLFNVYSMEMIIVRRMSKDPLSRSRQTKKLFMSGCNFSCLVLCG